MSIPSAREAMDYACQSGRSGDIEIARFWLDVARELREEFYARKPGGVVKPPCHECLHCDGEVKQIGVTGDGTRTWVHASGQSACPPPADWQDATWVQTFAESS